MLPKNVAEFPNQLMLGMDAARRTYWKHHGGSPGMSFLLTTFTETMKAAGLTENDLHRIFVTNPAQAYSFAHRAATFHPSP